MVETSGSSRTVVFFPRERSVPPNNYTNLTQVDACLRRFGGPAGYQIAKRPPLARTTEEDRNRHEVSKLWQH
jgi:hypothetical protein